MVRFITLACTRDFYLAKFPDTHLIPHLFASACKKFFTQICKNSYFFQIQGTLVLLSEKNLLPFLSQSSLKYIYFFRKCLDKRRKLVLSVFILFIAGTSCKKLHFFFVGLR